MLKSIIKIRVLHPDHNQDHIKKYWIGNKYDMISQKKYNIPGEGNNGGDWHNICIEPL